MKQYFAELSQEENRSIFGGIEYEWIYVNVRYIQIIVNS